MHFHTEPIRCVAVPQDNDLKCDLRLSHWTQGGRLCVVLAASQQGPPKGILLGSSPGGGAFYIEPPSAVPLNNDLAAARGEAAAAEENVLWQLTGQIIDNHHDLQAALDLVSLPMHDPAQGTANLCKHYPAAARGGAIAAKVYMLWPLAGKNFDIDHDLQDALDLVSWLTFLPCFVAVFGHHMAHQYLEPVLEPDHEVGAARGEAAAARAQGHVLWQQQHADR